MSDWIGIGVIIFIVLCALFGLSQLSKPYDVSVDEFEKRAQEGPSLMSAGLSGLQKCGQNRRSRNSWAQFGVLVRVTDSFAPFV